MADLKIGRLRAYAETLRMLSAQEGIEGRIVKVDRGARYISLAVRLKNHLQINKALALAEPLAGHTYTQVVIAQRERGLILYQFELPGHFWEVYTRADLMTGPGKIGVGLSDGRRQIDFSFDPPHILVAGTTGAGKSETVRSMLVGLFTAYAPGQLAAIIVDPDGDHADFCNVAHLGGVPVASDPGSIDRVLAYAHAQYLERKQANDRGRPPLVIVVDEAEDALADPKRLDMVTPIARHGRKYNVNLLLATQKPSENVLPGILDKINNRWIGAVQNARISAHLAGQAGLDCHKLTGKGDFMHVANGQSDRLLVAMTTSRDYEKLPRVELAPPVGLGMEPEPIDPDLDEVDEGSGDDFGGRPREGITARALAYYMVAGPGNVSKRQANESFGLGHVLHYRHRDFAFELIDELKRLYVAMKGANNGH
jgi:DNA segregation ATPase FtsK/SpoIIIE-like protein